jgi:tetratricopeptide (TPR) repeat protein/tRNA A-37 threonylcarbamoyl transferase component Bud32
MIGMNFGHYHIFEKIGQGGMGEVYLADDTMLQRKVALKFLPPEMQADAPARQRFMREAKSAAALDHPYICHINEVGEAEGKSFIVMEYVEGQTLEKKIEQRTLSPSEAQQIASEILEALAEAHGKGIIHRDLKPANIMIMRNGHVKVMDFGLAKQLLPAGSTADQEETLSAVTQSGAIVGTLAYMSPEQLQAKPADARSDIFSFGIVLYEMLAGSHPFQRTSAMETASAILTATPPPLDLSRRDFSDKPQKIMAKLLAKNPLERYQSANEVHADLSRMLQSKNPGIKSLRFSRPVWVAIGVIVLILGIAPMSWWVRESFFKSPQAALAFQERDWILIADVENLTGDPIFDRSLQTAMTIGIQQSRYVNVFPPVRVQEALQRMRKESGAKLDETLACEIAVREGIKAVLVCGISDVGGVYSLTARLVEPGKRATVMSQTANASGKNQVLSTLDSIVKSIRQSLGESLSSMSSQSLPLPKATTALIEALKTYADGIRIITSDENAGYELIKQAVAIDPDFALARADLGAACYADKVDGGRVKGEEHFTKALSLLNRLTLREQLWIRAVVEDCRGNSSKAAECYRTFLAQYPDDRDGWRRLGWLHMARQGQYEKAIEAFKRVLELDPSNAYSYVNIATCYMGSGQDEQARKNYEKGFELSPSDILGYNINSEYGLTLVRLGDLQKAAETFQKMIDADEVLKKARGFRSMAFLSMYQGKLSDAIADFKRAIQINRTEKASDSEFRDHLFLASVYQLKGRNADFISELTIADRILSQEPFDPSFISELATIYARIGKTREASRLLNGMSSQAKNLTALSPLNRTDQGDQASISEVKGEIALAKGKVAEAIECFELSLNLEPRNPRESLAFAYRRLGKLQEAANKYEEIIARFKLSGRLLEQWILAHYELAKIYRDLGDMQKAKKYYGKFLNIWKDADPDIPILKQAKAEYARL